MDRDARSRGQRVLSLRRLTRAFIAVRPPDAVLDTIAARVAAVAMPGAQLTMREQWHLTVQFLGDDADIDTVASAFAATPLDVGAGSVALGAPDAFGDRRRARVFALRLREGEAWMARVAAQVDRRLAPLGYRREEHEFVAHLTLARFREPTDVRALRSAFGSEPVGSAWRVGELVLYESVLRPDGARHTACARLPVQSD